MQRGSAWVGVGAVAAAALLLAVAVSSAPLEDEDKDKGDDVVYDQRQNGSENLRISLSDVRVVVAPGASLLDLTNSAVTTFAYMTAMGTGNDKQDCSEHGGRCKSAAANQQRSRLRLSGLLQPLTSRTQHAARPHHSPSP